LLWNATSCGFCIFNNVVIGALHALTLVQRVAIIDIDAHHGNGTADILRARNDPERLFFCSIHLFDSNEFYPGTGKHDELAQNMMNIPIAPLWRRSGVKSFDDAVGRSGFRRAFKQRVVFALRCCADIPLPAACRREPTRSTSRSFNPDLILISAGFDGARNDVGNRRNSQRTGQPGLDLTPEDFYHITREIQQV
jgi:acetoin utilization deacetylase AcuC-like enzyme